MTLTGSPAWTWRSAVPPQPITSSSGCGAMIITCPPAGDQPSAAGGGDPIQARTRGRGRRSQVLAIRAGGGATTTWRGSLAVSGAAIVVDDKLIPRQPLQRKRTALAWLDVIRPCRTTALVTYRPETWKSERM